MTIRSFTGYLNTDLIGFQTYQTGDTFNIGTTPEIEILLQDNNGDLVAEGDGVTQEVSSDPDGDQLAFIRDGSGTVLVDGSEFFLEATFTFTVGGQTFTGYHLEQQGGGTLNFTILPPGVPTGTATVGVVNFFPSPDEVPYADLSSGDEEIDDAPFANLDLSGGDEIIAGAGADEIFAGSGDDTVNAGGGADTVDGGAGDDTINAGGGADTVYGGAGDDIINGGGGADVIRGDTSIDPDEVNSESTDFSAIPDPSGDGTAIDDDDDVSAGFSLDTGTMQVSLSFADDDPNNTAAGFEFNSSDGQYTDGLNNGDGGTDNAILLAGRGTGDTSTTTISFSSNDATVEDEVQNVNFRLNDIDDAGWRDVVTIRAFDADGNPVEVTLTGGASMVLSDTDGVAGNDTATAINGSGNGNPSDADNSLLVEIAGPVASVEISYGNLEPGGQRIDLTEIFFDTIATDQPTGFNDTIDGGGGDDTIFGELGSDTIDGGAGTDALDGGVGDDTFVISAGTDTIAGGEGADTFDAENGSSLTGETITVDVDNSGTATIAKTNDGTTDTTTSVETYIADEDVAEADTITLTTTDLMTTEVSGIDDNAVGIFTPQNGAPPVAFGGPGQPTFSELISGAEAPGNNPAGRYQITDGDESGQVGNIAFENFENIDFSVVCFADGTLIGTDRGLRPVEALRIGDVVQTLDHGLQPLRWIGHRHMDAAILAAKPNLRPIRIKAGALGENTPARDLVVSPQHRILLKSKIAIRMFDTQEILVPAKQLLAVDGIDVADDLEHVTYHHILCDSHEIVEADGALAETLHTGTQAMNAMSAKAKQEIADIFGDLPFMNRPLARMNPKGKQARHLVARHLKNAKPLWS